MDPLIPLSRTSQPPKDIPRLIQRKNVSECLALMICIWLYLRIVAIWLDVNLWIYSKFLRDLTIPKLSSQINHLAKNRAGQGLPGSCILDINQFGSFAGFFLNCRASERGSDKKCHRIWRKTSPEVPDATWSAHGKLQRDLLKGKTTPPKLVKRNRLHWWHRWFINRECFPSALCLREAETSN